MSTDVPNLTDALSTIACQQASVVKPSATIRDLAKAMVNQECSAVIVTRHDGSHAVVTERDICAALAGDSDPDADWAVDVMTVELLTLNADQPIVEAARLMHKAAIRHVVVAEGDQLSMVSVRDLLGPLLASTPSPT